MGEQGMILSDCLFVWLSLTKCLILSDCLFVWLSLTKCLMLCFFFVHKRG